ncbi:MAG: zinc ribbon domain-containing protein [Clostridia bacterium]|nr:zinc ribbon domain-containing protein [Clostridia bacterium]
MDFLDNALNKAKEVIDVAYKKTEEVVATEKQRFDIASLNSKIEKDYKALGEIYYNLLKESDDIPDEAKPHFADITEKLERIKELRDDIGEAKNKAVCPHCQSYIPKNCVYCSVCGEKLK